MSERWDPHDHRDELQILYDKFVYHPEHGVLCYWYAKPNGQFIIPLEFKEGEAAKWIESGSIAHIQESTQTLEIGFRTEVFRPRDPHDWEKAVAEKPAAPADRIDQLETALREAIELIRECVPEFHAQGMGCGIEDRSIHDRYEAAQHGWEKAIERVEEHFGDAADEFEAVLFIPADKIEVPKLVIPEAAGDAADSLKQIQAGMNMNALVPRAPLQLWTYNANGVYCPDCMPEDITERILPLSERNGELPNSCSRCGTLCEHPVKGDRGAECNRTICKKGDANWFHHSTRAWYCRDCAGILNEANHDDAQRLYGHALCTFGSGGARDV